MKLLRSLKPLDDLQVPTIGDRCEIASLRGVKFPQAPARRFMQEVSELSGRKKRLALLGKHAELFGAYPNDGVPLEVVRARCVYRLQYEGHRISNTQPSERFMQNYRAVVGRFSDEKPFEGCTRIVADIAPRLALLEGVTTMSAKKKAKTLSRKSLSNSKVSKAKIVNMEPARLNDEPASMEEEGKRQDAKAKISATALIRFMAKQLGANHQQIDTALKALNLHAAPATINAQRHRALKGILPIPKLDAEMEKKVKAAVPAAEVKLVKAAEPKNPDLVPVKVAKKVIKKVVKKDCEAF
jgi:hypothetical protein